MSIAISLLAVAVCVAFAAAVHRRNRRRVVKHLVGREALGNEQFASLFPSPLEGKVGVSLLRLLAPWVRFDVALIRPADRFCADLLLGVEDGLDANEFVASVEREWRIDLPDEEAAELRTVAELAHAVARRVSGVQSNLSLNTDPQRHQAAPPPMLRSGQLQR